MFLPTQMLGYKSISKVIDFNFLNGVQTEAIATILLSKQFKCKTHFKMREWETMFMILKKVTFKNRAWWYCWYWMSLFPMVLFEWLLCRCVMYQDYKDYCIWKLSMTPLYYFIDLWLSKVISAAISLREITYNTIFCGFIWRILFQFIQTP